MTHWLSVLSTCEHLWTTHTHTLKYHQTTCGHSYMNSHVHSYEITPTLYTVSALLVKIRNHVAVFHRSVEECETLKEMGSSSTWKTTRYCIKFSQGGTGPWRLWNIIGSSSQLCHWHKESKSPGGRLIWSHRGRHDPDSRFNSTYDPPEKHQPKCLSDKKTPTIPITVHFRIWAWWQRSIGHLRWRTNSNRTLTVVIHKSNTPSTWLQPWIKDLNDDNHTKDTVFLEIIATVERMIRLHLVVLPVSSSYSHSKVYSALLKS